ncbi:prolipoprotein diacylglyceryl transferase [Streptococcus alactolyticus]|jgi:phosphatidylglycerol:prolipoprotein diacylglycerol transferase|uniref:Phosphatidylglycerol--prolipoprotein diacylglyceryl transferase n=2 Tax=Streptococcus alactolyticus TaxID=29389 RepID=A0ABY7M0L3_STRAY|nr:MULTISPECIES: prolipoprotein diacylglyceryl transferase [Streptococcus]MCI6904414.1 prolipoprotein diacylglyceryl transferase [Streptococcus alactolyticus]MDE2587292.1 prolipoprotein diacylglyceryl transferase [Lactobacillales bacterium]MDY5187493.1 prolipoprotein diacylglyceryl transferase [Streptococcus alactolyticus]WBB05968.1 prolipoprotein diacylglyceryl transferase [Streptococcus alactolyticus]
MINPIALQLGPFSIHWYAICIVLGMLLAVYLAMREAPRRHILPDAILDFILIAFPLAIIGARLYYVVFDWSYYASQPPSEVFAIWHGGLAIYGGLITGAIVLFVFSYYRAINPLDFLDIAAPGVMIAQAIGRWGNFVNQEAYGKIVSHLNYLPNFIQHQMYIDGAYRVPTFLYESVWNLLGFILILSVRRQPHFLKRGDITFFYLIWYGCGRFVIEGMRTDSLMFFGMRVSQWLSAILVIVGLFFMVWRRCHQKDIPYYQEA